MLIENNRKKKKGEGEEGRREKGEGRTRQKANNQIREKE
jgi:hypothetical protein